MNSCLASKISSFCVPNLRNNPLLRAIRALNLNILDHNLLRPELTRGSLVLCGLVMWAFAIQRLVFVWRWSSVNKKISGLLFVMLFPAICGYYLYYMDKQEAEQEARKSARQAANEPF